jgi:hypothetical protein
VACYRSPFYRMRALILRLTATACVPQCSHAFPVVSKPFFRSLFFILSHSLFNLHPPSTGLIRPLVSHHARQSSKGSPQHTHIHAHAGHGRNINNKKTQTQSDRHALHSGPIRNKRGKQLHTTRHPRWYAFQFSTSPAWNSGQTKEQMISFVFMTIPPPF